MIPLDLPPPSLDELSNVSFSIVHPALELFPKQQDSCKLTHVSYKHSYSSDLTEPFAIISDKDPNDNTRLTLFLLSFQFVNYDPTITIRCNLNFSGKTLNEAYARSSYRVDSHNPSASIGANMEFSFGSFTFFGNAVFLQPSFALDVTPQAGFLSVTEVGVGANSGTSISGSVILAPPIAFSQDYNIRNPDVFCIASPILLSYTISSLSYIPLHEPSKKPSKRVNSRLLSIDYGETQKRCYSPVDGPIFTRDPIIFQVSLEVKDTYLQGTTQFPLTVTMPDPREDVAKPNGTAWLTREVFFPGGYPFGYKSPDRSSGARDSYDKLDIGLFETVLLVRMVPDVVTGLHTAATSYSLEYETGVPEQNTSYTQDYLQSFQEAVSLALYRGGLTSRRCAGLTAVKHVSSTNRVITYYPQVRCHDIDNMILAMDQIRYHTYPFMLNLLEKYGVSGRLEFEYSQVPSSCVNNLERNKDGFYVFSPVHTEESCLASSFSPVGPTQCTRDSDCFASVCHETGTCAISFPLKESAATSFSRYLSGVGGTVFMTLFYFFFMF